MTDLEVKHHADKALVREVYDAIVTALASEDGPEFGLQAAYRHLDHAGRDIFTHILINRLVQAISDVDIARFRLEFEKVLHNEA